MSLLHRHTAALAEIEWTNECLVCDAWIPPGVGREVLIHADDCAWLEALELVELSEEIGLYDA